eukprot:jgi/Tetstr1/442453/TSEL_003199.t1
MAFALATVRTNVREESRGRAGRVDAYDDVASGCQYFFGSRRVAPRALWAGVNHVDIVEFGHVAHSLRDFGDEAARSGDVGSLGQGFAFVNEVTNHYREWCLRVAVRGLARDQHVCRLRREAHVAVAR